MRASCHFVFLSLSICCVMSRDKLQEQKSQKNKQNKEKTERAMPTNLTVF